MINKNVAKINENVLHYVEKVIYLNCRKLQIRRKMPQRKEVPMTLREIRKLKGFTTQYVAEKLGIKPRSLNKKERDNKFTVLQAETLCLLYGVRLEEVDI
jgi:DNA-binding XRE family transcriptional regulator